MARDGKFIVLDGIDGGGKTQALAYVRQKLESSDYPVVVTREPGGTEEGTALRQLLVEKDTHDWEPMAELLLMTAARVQHVARVIRPALEEGRVVLCDRFVGATIAYQGGGRGISTAKILQLHKIALDDIWPDLTVILDLDPATGLERSRARLSSSGSSETRFEDLDLSFHQRVRQSFLDQAAERPQSYTIIDADRPSQIVQEDVLQTVLKALGPPRPRGART